MKWQCSFHDSKGKRCENEALFRVHFSEDHPFDHSDTCREHLERYRVYAWIQDLHTNEEVYI